MFSQFGSGKKWNSPFCMLYLSIFSLNECDISTKIQNFQPKKHLKKEWPMVQPCTEPMPLWKNIIDVFTCHPDTVIFQGRCHCFHWFIVLQAHIFSHDGGALRITKPATSIKDETGKKKRQSLLCASWTLLSTHPLFVNVHNETHWTRLQITALHDDFDPIFPHHSYWCPYTLSRSESILV